MTKLFQNDPEHGKLYELAEHGVVIDRPVEFIPSTSPPTMRHLHKQLLNAFRTHALKKWNKGKTLILPYKDLDAKTISQLHFNGVHWTIKPKQKTALAMYLVDL